ncbi:MAG: imelysin family protein [Myxococcales bacterium]|nr:imelysin family protein [Myxococcales bacterium]
MVYLTKCSNPTRSSLFYTALFAWAFSLGSSCSDTQKEEEPPGVDGGVQALARQAFLLSQVDNVFLPTYERLADATKSLQIAVEAYASASSSDNQTTSQKDAQDAFITASAAIQEAELLQLGPYGDNVTFFGGTDLRNRIYSWPVVNTCKVDEETVDAAYSETDFFTNSLVTAYGLDALERLLFSSDFSNTCPNQHSLNSQGRWDALGEAGIIKNRAEYAAVVAAKIAEDSETLLNEWKMGFGEQLRTAGTSSDVYSTSQDALDQIFASMFYFEISLKDSKLGEPLGITALCSQKVCPDALESQFAQQSLEWIQANLKSFERLLHGGEPDDEQAVGFLELLEEMNANELAEELAQLTSNAIQATAAVSSPLAENLERPETEELYQILRDIGTLLKTQLSSTLALDVPEAAAGDND